MVRKYGTNAGKLFEYAKACNDGTLPREVFAQLKYAVEHEMAAKPIDFFIRRTGALYFNINWVQKWKAPVIAWMAREFSWNEKTEKQYTEELEAAIREAVPAE
jgi:glycerol-3-phosphate dehydrogenase